MANVRISDGFMNESKNGAKAHFRSIEKQIEYWARIRKAAEENPDPSIDFIKDCAEKQQNSSFPI